jgi:tRNA threonylcarbamoyladenosine biosynthesis protein TsaB
MALAQHMPVVGIPTLDVLAAAQAVRELPMVCVLQAGRGRLAAGWYQPSRGQWQAKGEATVTSAEALVELIEKPTLVCGELTAAERQVFGRKKKTALLISPAHSLRRPGFLAELGWKRWQAGKVDDVVSLAPIYLHVAEEIPA